MHRKGSVLYTPPQPLCHDSHQPLYHDSQELTPLHRATIAHLPQKKARTHHSERYLTPTIVSDPILIPTDLYPVSPIPVRPLPSPRNLETDYGHYEVVANVAPHPCQTDDNALNISSHVVTDPTRYVYST